MALAGYAFLLLSICALAHYWLAIHACRRFFVGERDTAPAKNFRPPVSILKPISGADDETYANLATFCRQDYPTYEIIFGVRSADDPAVSIIERLAAACPDITVRYAIARAQGGTNPKVTNLAAAYDQARHDLLVFSDADVRVGSDYLSRIVAPFADESTGVVTCLYRTQASGFVAAFEALALATEAVPIDLLSRHLEGMTFAMGPTIAVRRAALDHIGGLTPIADYLHDDYQLGNMLFRAGEKIKLSHYIVDHVVGQETVSDFLQRQIRWTRGTRCARPLGYFGLIFTFGTVWSPLYLLATGGTVFGWLVFAAVWLTRYLLAWLAGVRYLQDANAKRLLALVPLRDFLSFGFWLHGFFGDTIVWRGRRLKLLRDGKLADVRP